MINSRSDCTNNDTQRGVSWSVGATVMRSQLLYGVFGSGYGISRRQGDLRLFARIPGPGGVNKPLVNVLRRTLLAFDNYIDSNK